MNKKKYHKIWLFLLLTTASFLFQTLTACSDDENKQEQNLRDDEEEFSAEEKFQMKQINAVWTVLNKLADNDSLTEDFAQRKYTPTYGKVLDEATPYTRSMKADSLEEAIDKFQQIVGEWDFAEPTSDGYNVILKYPTQEGEEKMFGKLTFHKGEDKMLTAYVDVEIPCLPTLNRINYLPKEAWGDNEDVTSPYNIGEIVYYNGTWLWNNRGYYICARHYNGASKGVLVHLSRNFDSKFSEWMDKGWRPLLPSEREDVKSYLTFIKDWGAILDKDIAYLKKNYSGEEASICPDGFHKDGYVYSYYTPAAIVMNGYFGSWSWFYYYRNVIYYELPGRNKYGSEGNEKRFEYIRDKTWDKFYDSHQLYTMSALYFKEKPLNRVIPIYDPAIDR